MESLAGKVALVTGGAQGFGLAITHMLLKRGAMVSCLSKLYNTTRSIFLFCLGGSAGCNGCSTGQHMQATGAAIRDGEGLEIVV